jgi:Cu(I)/Ag(I) efflux system membrane fusion protein
MMWRAPEVTARIRWASAGAMVAALVFALALRVTHLGGNDAAPSAPLRAARDQGPHPSGAAAHSPARAGQHGEHEHAPTLPRAPVHASAEQAAGLGLLVEPVRRESVARTIRAVAVVVPDEARLAHVHTYVSGWVERLHVSTTGEEVRRGQAVADLFSRELLAAQGEYLALLELPSRIGAVALEGARSRLGVLGMRSAAIAALERRGSPLRTITIAAPRAGVVIHRGVTVGTAVDPGTELVTIADLGRVWVLAEVPEADIAHVEVGAPARLDLPASGREPFDAKVAFLYPTLTERTRTLRVRFEVDNADRRLRPGIYGTAELATAADDVLTVSRDAVVDTGPARHVFVVGGEGHYVPRAVAVGTATDGRIEVRDGLEEGELVVTSGVFLLDSESRLRASGGGNAHAGH